ncbi:MAG: hypothetical protein ABR886_09380 [Dehalococcoidales bacterium]|jgi:hypothetical protein
MSCKYKYLYLYLALACLLGIILIFVFDGYIGVYDTLTVKSGEMPLVVTADQWRNQDRSGFFPTVSVNYGDEATFTYEIANRRFFAYKEEITVSVWQNDNQIDQLLDRTTNIGAFGKETVNWSFQPSKYFGPASQNTFTEFTLVIKRGSIERNILIQVSSAGGVIKVIPPV